MVAVDKDQTLRQGPNTALTAAVTEYGMFQFYSLTVHSARWEMGKGARRISSQKKHGAHSLF